MFSVMLPVSVVPGSSLGVYLSLGLIVAVLLIASSPNRSRLLSGALVAVLGSVVVSDFIMQCKWWMGCW